MIITIIKGIALASSLLVGGVPFLSSGVAPQETVAAAAVEDREGAAEAAVQAIEDEVGHDLV
ncbi:hypothetical protein V5S96_10905, partial [Corynebacterium mastitidis]